MKKTQYLKILIISVVLIGTQILQSFQVSYAQNSNKVQINLIEQCVKNKIEYFRKVEGEGPHIRSDMLEEWQSECKNTKNSKNNIPVASNSHETSASELGEKYYFGDGVTQDFKKAFHYFLIAAKQGDAYSQAALGNMYLNGEGVQNNYAEAYKWSQLAAKKNDPTGQNTLGAMYERGLGVTQNYLEARRYYELAAQQGLSNAQNNLGYLYYYGRGVNRDFTEASKWFKLAADQGYTSSLSMLGEMYQNGKGVQKNYSEAWRLLRLAAEQGDVNALNRQGIMYQQGFGVEKNLNEAARMYKLAADKGHKGAQENLKKIEKYLAAKQAQQNEVTWNFPKELSSQVAYCSGIFMFAERTSDTTQGQRSARNMVINSINKLKSKGVSEDERAKYGQMGINDAKKIYEMNTDRGRGASVDVFEMQRGMIQAQAEIKNAYQECLSILSKY